MPFSIGEYLWRLRDHAGRLIYLACYGGACGAIASGHQVTTIVLIMIMGFVYQFERQD